MVSILGGCLPTGTDVVACDPRGCISENKLSDNIVSKLKGNVVRYVVIVGALPAAFGGQARTPSDPPATTMLPDLTMYIASNQQDLDRGSHHKDARGSRAHG